MKGVVLVENILIVSSTEQGMQNIADLIGEDNYSRRDSASSAESARRLLASQSYDTVFINSPLRDEFGDELARRAAASSDTGVIMFVKNELEAETESKVCTYGVFVIAKPVNKALFYKAVRLLEAVSYRMKGVQSENDRLQRKIDDDRTINRAKAVLMKYLSMSEPQAHKYLEKQAMDLRITKAEVAKRLLSTYEN